MGMTVAYMILRDCLPDMQLQCKSCLQWSSDHAAISIQESLQGSCIISKPSAVQLQPVTETVLMMF